MIRTHFCILFHVFLVTLHICLSITKNSLYSKSDGEFLIFNAQGGPGLCHCLCEWFVDLVAGLKIPPLAIAATPQQEIKRPKQVNRYLVYPVLRCKG